MTEDRNYFGGYLQHFDTIGTPEEISDAYDRVVEQLESWGGQQIYLAKNGEHVWSGYHVDGASAAMSIDPFQDDKQILFFHLVHTCANVAKKMNDYVLASINGEIHEDPDSERALTFEKRIRTPKSTRALTRIVRSVSDIASTYGTQHPFDQSANINSRSPIEEQFFSAIYHVDFATMMFYISGNPEHDSCIKVSSIMDFQVDGIQSDIKKYKRRAILGRKVFR